MRLSGNGGKRCTENKERGLNRSEDASISRRDEQNGVRMTGMGVLKGLGRKAERM